MIEALFRVIEGHTLLAEGKQTPTEFMGDCVPAPDFATLIAPQAVTEVAGAVIPQEPPAIGLKARLGAPVEAVDSTGVQATRQSITPTEIADLALRAAPVGAASQKALPQESSKLSPLNSAPASKVQGDARPGRLAPPAMSKGVGIFSGDAQAIGLTAFVRGEARPARPVSQGDQPRPQPAQKAQSGNAVSDAVRTALAPTNPGPDTAVAPPIPVAAPEQPERPAVPKMAPAVATAATAAPAIAPATDVATPKVGPEGPDQSFASPKQANAPRSGPPAETFSPEADGQKHLAESAQRPIRPEGVSSQPSPDVHRGSPDAVTIAAKAQPAVSTEITSQPSDATRQTATAQIPAPPKETAGRINTREIPALRDAPEAKSGANDPQRSPPAQTSEARERETPAPTKAPVEPQATSKSLTPEVDPIRADMTIELKAELPLAQRLQSETVAQTTPVTRDAPSPEPAARTTVSQIADAITRSDGDKVEVRLSPEELGRVRLSLGQGEHGMHVQLTAERAETLDLMRRNIALLEADLRHNGFSNLTFSFGESGDGRGQHRDGGGDPISDDTIDAEAPTRQAAPATGRIDIRL